MGNVGTGNLGDVGTCGEREREREQARTGRPETRLLWCVCARIFARLAVPSCDLSRRHLCLLSFIAVLP